MTHNIFYRIVLLGILLSFSVSPVFAAVAATPSGSITKSATNSAATNKLEELKERLATKVAELRTTEKRAMYGVVKSKSITTLVLEMKTKDLKVELTDEIKIFQYLKGKRTELTLDNLSKGDAITVYGDYDTTLDLLKATYILIQATLPMRVSGTIEALNRTDYSLKLKTAEGQTYTIDIETTTKVTRWDKINKFTKSGFSKMVEGDTIHVVGTSVPKKENRISGIRILNLGNPVGEPPPTPSPTPEESTPSATPKTTFKATPTP